MDQAVQQQSIASEEVPVVVGNEEQGTQVEPTIEDRAREQGWRPKEEFDGPLDKWVSAETFVAKGELIEKIEALGKELKSQKKANQMLLEHHHKVKESEFKRAVDYLKQQKKQAYETGDVDKIIEIDDQIASVRETQKQQTIATQQEEQQQNGLHPEFQSWVSENKWYEKDSEMRETADALGIAYAQKHPDQSPGQVLKYAESQIKKLYKDRFENQNRNRPTSVEGSGSGSIGKVSGISFEMTEEEKQVMTSFVRSGIMSKEDYIAELKSMRGVK